MADTRIRDESPACGERLLATECSVAKLTFRRRDVPAVRHFARAFGARLGMRSARLSDFALAASEAAACAVSHGPCAARMRLWTTGARVCCEIRGDGIRLGHGPRAVEHGDADAMRRRLLERICDHASVESGPYGITVSFSMTVASE
jgi:hypothetical protein